MCRCVRERERERERERDVYSRTDLTLEEQTFAKTRLDYFLHGRFFLKYFAKSFLPTKNFTICPEGPNWPKTFFSA